MIFLAVIYIRNKIFSYKTPRPFPISQIDTAVNYDFQVVELLNRYLKSYSKEGVPLKDKVVLELGPGPDLGIGLILLTMGVKKYIAVDVHNLAKGTPTKFYENLLAILKERFPCSERIDLENQLFKYYKGVSEKISYIVDQNFNISKIKDRVDIVFSNAAFEHFTNVEMTIKELNNIIKAGGILISTIDLQTHTRWIRDRDPLNIYRYNDFLWNLFKVKGSPNRVRSFEYKDLLEKNGWYDIQIEPLQVLDEECLQKVRAALNNKFRNLDASELRMLSIIVMAKKR